MRNDLCPCGSGRKYKKCCAGKTDAVRPGRGPSSLLTKTLGYFVSLLDYVIAPLCILLILFDPNFVHGLIDFLESGQYLSWANGILHGKTPYKDFFILFGPFQIYIISFVLLLFGKTLAVLRTYFYINYLLSFLTVYFLARTVCKKRLFVYAAVVACLVEVSQPFWAARWDFGRMGLGMAILLLLAIFIKRKDMKLLFACGILSCISVFYTLDIGVIGIFTTVVSLGAYSCISSDPALRKIGAFLRYLAWYASGALLVAIPFFLFLLSQGALLVYLKTVLYIIPKYHMAVWGQHAPSFGEAFRGVSSLSTLIGNPLVKIYIPLFIYPAVFFYLIFVGLKKKWDEETVVVFAIFVYGAFAYRTSFRAIMGPQFQVALPPLIILISFFLAKGWNLIASTYGNLRKNTASSAGIIKALCAVMLFVCVTTYFVASPKRYYGTFKGWTRYQEVKQFLIGTYSMPIAMGKAGLVRSQIPRVGDILIPEWEERVAGDVVKYIESNAATGDEVFCFPEHGLYNFLADRPAPGRFYIPGFAWTTKEWQEELLGSLIAKPPKIVVYSTSLSNMARSIGRNEELLPEVSRFIREKYREAARYGDVIIYEKNLP